MRDMVSLGTNFNMNTGAQFMDANRHEGGAAVPGGERMSTDQQELLNPVLTSNEDSGFKSLKTIPAFSIHLMISTAISFAGIVMAACWPDEKRCEAYFIMLYIRAVFWVITFFFDHIVKRHHETLRMNGYHEFHKATETQKGIPLTIVSLWNSTLLAVQALIHHCYGEKFWEHCIAGLLSPISFVTAFTLAENIVLALTHSCYISKVFKFNKSKHPPDAMRGGDNSSGSLGLMQPGGNTAELLEKQADLIAYLREHNLKLSQKLHQMQVNTRSTIN